MQLSILKSNVLAVPGITAEWVKAKLRRPAAKKPLGKPPTIGAKNSSPPPSMRPPW